MEKNYLLKIEYDGSEFSGWQRQPEKRTVQGTLEDVLSKVMGGEVTLNGTSRTDAGVHALGQCASFKGDYGIPTEKIVTVANNILLGNKPGQKLGDLRILSVDEKPLDFHARFDSKGKMYRYIIHNSGEPKVFRRNYVYEVPDLLDVSKMVEAKEYIVGTHDFKCFESSGANERDTTVRTVYKLDINKVDEDVIIEISGDGFLYNMVRNIVGTLVEIGLGKRDKEEIKNAIEKKDRSLAGHKAPASGLYLVEVYY